MSGRICRMTGRVGAGVTLAALLTGCAGLVGDSGSASPPETSRQPQQQQPARTTRAVDPQQAERLKRVMLPLIKAMDHPLPTNQVKIGIMDDEHINAASAGGGEFYVTRGLLEKANDQQLAGVLAHELAHDDLRHVAKAQALGTGLSIGMVILDQIVPGSGALDADRRAAADEPLQLRRKSTPRTVTAWRFCRRPGCRPTSCRPP